jgi:phosphoribosyl-dephospho-CoA transferase
MYSRHDLVWLTSEGWHAAAVLAGPRERAAIELWAGEDWPATVRRGGPDVAADSVALGLSLPPDPARGAKPKIAIHARREHVARRSCALPLSHALDCAPGEWRATLAALDAAAQPSCLRTYGSLALQAITGRLYLTASSDIDLLFHPSSVAELDTVTELLAAQAMHLPLDGEIIFPRGDAVAWKEWRDAGGGSGRVLVKSLDGVRLAEPATLLAALEGK